MKHLLAGMALAFAATTAPALAADPVTLQLKWVR